MHVFEKGILFYLFIVVILNFELVVSILPFALVKRVSHLYRICEHFSKKASCSQKL